MLRCFEGNREIPPTDKAYILEHPRYGSTKRLIIGEKVMDRLKPKKRIKVRFRGEGAQGLNVFFCWTNKSGKSRKGRFLFAVDGRSLLTTLPRTFHTFWELPV
jgi:hypothetical protein